MAVENAHIDSLAIDSIATDSLGLAADSVDMVVPGEEMQGLVIINPLSAYRQDTKPESSINSTQGMSWIYLAIAVLFCVIGIKLKGSIGYIKALFSDLTDTRVRHNVFDDTVKETSMIILLNAMWVICAGIVLWIGIRNQFFSQEAGWSIGISLTGAQCIGLCILCAAIYLIAMMVAYWAVGNVFSDRRHSVLWLKGAASSLGLETFLMLPIALVALNYEAWSGVLFVLGVIVFIVGKIIFIYQGFRIFFAQISSWLLFLCYLCSLEIIPVIFTYGAAVALCTTIK